MRKPKPNFLDMVPIRNVEHFTHEGNRITLLIPKFKKEWMRRWFIPPKRSPHIRIHLDETGSKVWELIDGQRNTCEICSRISHSLPENNRTDNSVELRVTEFLRQLYKNRFIVFRQSTETI
jgi:hypothetical protein